MGRFTRLTGFVRPYRRAFILCFLAAVLSSALDGFTFALLLPFFRTLFDLSNAVAEAPTAVFDWSTPARYAALKSGSVDGTIMWFPVTLIATNEGYRMLADLNDIITDWPYLGYYAMARVLNTQRDKITRYLRAHVKGLEWLRANPSGGVRLMVEDVKIPPEYAGAGYKEFMKSFAFDGRIPIAGFELLMESEGQKLKGKFKVTDFLDQSFHKQFVKK